MSLQGMSKIQSGHVTVVDITWPHDGLGAEVVAKSHSTMCVHNNTPIM